MNDNSIEIKRYNNYLYLTLLELIALLFIIYIILYYPIITGTFDYWHTCKIIGILQSGLIDPSDYFSGYYTLTAILSEIAGISPDLITILPLQLVPFLFLFVLILRETTSHKNYKSILLIFLINIGYLARFGSLSVIQWYCHGVGMLLALSIVSLVIIRLRKNENQAELSLAILLLFLGLNQISYKLIFLSIFYLIIFQIMELIESFFNDKRLPKKSNFLIMILLVLVIVLTFNKFFYNGFLPKISTISEIGALGTYKISLLFYHDEFNPLDKYILRTPPELRIANVLWMLLISINIMFFLLAIFSKIKKRQLLNLGEKSLLTFFICALLILIIYSSLGLFDLNFIILVGFLGYSVSYQFYKDKMKIIILLLILSIIIINFYTTAININIDYNRGMNEENFEYIIVPTSWYIENILENSPNLCPILVSDVFTGGFLSKEIAKQKTTRCHKETIFSNHDMLMLLDVYNSSETKSRKMVNKFYFINEKLYRISAQDWDIFSTWKMHDPILSNNMDIDKIYNTGYILVFTENFERLS